MRDLMANVLDESFKTQRTRPHDMSVFNLFFSAIFLIQVVKYN